MIEDFTTNAMKKSTSRVISSFAYRKELTESLLEQYPLLKFMNMMNYKKMYVPDYFVLDCFKSYSSIPQVEETTLDFFKEQLVHRSEQGTHYFHSYFNDLQERNIIFFEQLYFLEQRFGDRHTSFYLTFLLDTQERVNNLSFTLF